MDHQHGYISRKDDYLTRLRRIEGQARGLQRMVDEEISDVTGVESVEVVLETGKVTIASGTPLDPADIEAAVAEAGCAVA